MGVTTTTLASLVSIGVTLVELHGPGGQVLIVNPAEVSSLRQPLDIHQQHWPRGTHCIVVMANAGSLAVSEDCHTVQHLLSQ